MSTDIRVILNDYTMKTLKRFDSFKSEAFEIAADIFYKEVMEIVVNTLRDINRGFSWMHLRSYNRAIASVDAHLMFGDREELITHLKSTNGDSYLIPIDEDLHARFIFAHNAARATKVADSILSVCKYSDTVVLEKKDAESIIWLMDNIDKVVELITEDKETEE